jgi:hypothetical protein
MKSEGVALKDWLLVGGIRLSNKGLHHNSLKVDNVCGRGLCKQSMVVLEKYPAHHPPALIYGFSGQKKTSPRSRYRRPSRHHCAFRRRSIAVTLSIALALAPSIACRHRAVCRPRAAAALPPRCRRRHAASTLPPSRRQVATAVALSRCRHRHCHRHCAAAKLPPTSRSRAAATAADAAAAAAPSPSYVALSRCSAAAISMTPLPCRISFVGCCVVVRCPISSSHAVMRPSTLSLPAASAINCFQPPPLPPQPPPPPPWSNSPSYIVKERGMNTFTSPDNLDLFNLSTVFEV